MVVTIGGIVAFVDKSSLVCPIYTELLNNYLYICGDLLKGTK